MTASLSSAFREISPQRADEFVAKGYKRRHFFPHRAYHLPKCGPDGFRLARHLCGRDDPQAMWEIVLYADPAVSADFPPGLFFDDDVIWHQQQFGRPGQVATASLVLHRRTVHAVTLVSDLVQRISRRREHKTRVEKRFDGWRHMLLNAVLAFAAENRARYLRIPGAELALRHTGRARDVSPELFRRIYDRTVNSLLPARRDGDWWVVRMSQARDRVVVPTRRDEGLPRTRTVCICHDTERGMGHELVDPGFARRAEQSSPRDLDTMREIEAELGVRATYCVVGALLPEVRHRLEADGHCLAFHSFDHRLDRDRQLHRCREVDYRIKGYRPPQSKITRELTDRNLLFHNFEWLAAGSKAVGVSAPAMHAGLVRIPVSVDDYPMHAHGMSYEEWERDALSLIAGRDFTAIGLHDCYAPHWLDRYRGFLGKVGEMAELRTLDEVSAEVTLASAA